MDRAAAQTGTNETSPQAPSGKAMKAWKGDHGIDYKTDCKIGRLGRLQLTTEFVKKGSERQPLHPALAVPHVG